MTHFQIVLLGSIAALAVLIPIVMKVTERVVRKRLESEKGNTEKLQPRG